MPEAPDPIFWIEAEAAEQLRMSRSTLQKLRFHNDPAGPPYVRLGRVVRYPVAEVRAWAKAAGRIAGGRS